MKYHCKKQESNESLCGLVIDTPSTWVFDSEEFLLGHYNKKMQCKICYRAINPISGRRDKDEERVPKISIA